MSGRPLRVGLLCPYDFDVPGGVREQVLGIARSVAEEGLHAEVFAPRRRGSPRREQVDGVLVVSAGPAVGVRANGSTARLALDPRARRRAARWATSGFDVVHVHEPLTPGIGHTVLRELAADRDLGLPGPAMVATVHVGLDAGPAGRSRSLRSASRLVRGLLRHVDLLSAVSERARRTVVDHLGRVPLVVPNGVDVASWPAPQTGQARGSRPPTVVVLGRAAEPRKGVDVLLRAWPRVRLEVPAAELFVVGPAEGLRVGGGHGVHLLGPVDEATKRRLVCEADVLVAPHRGGESFGIVLVEAMAAGTPVVASDLPAFRAVLGGHGTLVPPGDPVALGAGVVDVLVRGATAEERLAERRRAEEFDWSVVGRRWSSLYATALRVRDGRGEPWRELAEAVAERARRAAALADAPLSDAPLTERVPGEASSAGGASTWRDLLRRSAAEAADPADEAAQSRLTVLARDPRLPGRVRGELWRATARVRDTRALVNDLARRDGAPTVEFDDGAEDGTDGWTDGSTA